MISAVETNSSSAIESSEAYKYDVFGSLIEEDATPYTSGLPGTTTVSRYAVDGWNPAKAGAMGNSGTDTWAVLDGSNALQTRNIDLNGINQHLATVTTAGVSFFLTDRQGSVRNVINGSGTVTSTITYDAFGNVLTGTPGEFGYAGYRYDGETKLDLVEARVYDPAKGGWTTQDPEQFGAGDSNLYRYVNNAPTNAVDPSGMQQGGYWPPPYKDYPGVLPPLDSPDYEKWQRQQDSMRRPADPSLQKNRSQLRL